MDIILAVLTGLLIAPFVLPLTGIIGLLVNEPNKNRRSDDDPGEKSDFGYFVNLEPGRAVLIEKGSVPVRAMMNYAKNIFAGEEAGSATTLDDPDYWKVVKVEEPDKKGSHPVPFPRVTWAWWLYFPLSIYWWMWKRWVYKITGAAWTGFYPFVRIRIYPMTKYIVRTGKGPTIDGRKEGEVFVEQKLDWSNHYRVAHFQFADIVPEADTQDKLPVKVVMNGTFRVSNPYQTAYNTDDLWATRLLGDMTTAITSFTRTRRLDDVLSAMPADDPSTTDPDVTPRDTALDFVKDVAHRVGVRTPSYGIETLQEEATLPQLLDVSPANEEHRTAVSGLAIARINRASAEEAAIGGAAPTREQGKAMREYPEAAIIPQIEGSVRMAEAAGQKPGGIVIVNTGQGFTPDPVQLATLKGVRNLDPSSGGAPTSSTQMEK